ncbi:MAG: DUF6151 family protein [Betaproteobacteria bacterium]
MNVPLRCGCGAIQGYVEALPSGGRAVCYCRDGQAFARFLGRHDDILDSHGGTDIIASLPRSVHFTSGADKMACMSLSPRGLLRWYASCCRTPIGNTPRDRKLSYLGLVRNCLPETDAAFGPVKIELNTGSARGKVEPTPLATFFGIVKIMKNVFGARLSGKYRENPFFESDSGAPIKAPQILTLAERKALDGGA